MPKISVVMPVYNSERYLREALDSIINQSFSDFECLVIDDGSTDGSSDIIKSFNDPRIICITKDHSGLIDTLNQGIAQCKGDYIARCDSDDICEPDRFKCQVDFLDQNPLCVVVGSHAVAVDEHNKVMRVLDYPPINTRSIRTYALFHNPFVHSSVMIRKKVLDISGGYRKHYLHAEDYELWTRIIYKNECANIPKRLIRYRIHGAQVTQKNNITMRFWGVIVRGLAFFRFVSNL